MGAMGESSRKWQCSGLATCSGFGACAHEGRLVRVDVAVGQRDLRAGPFDIEAAALPEKWCSLSEGSRKVLPSVRWEKVPGNGRCSGLVACAHIYFRRVRVNVAPCQGHVPVVDIEAAALPSEGRCLLSEVLAFGSFSEVHPWGRWKNVPGNGRCSGFEKVPGNFRCSGLVACSGFGACAHVARLVRVDVAVGELHVAVLDVEAAALPEKWRSLSEASRKALPSGRWEKLPGNVRRLGFGGVLGLVRICARVLTKYASFE